MAYAGAKITAPTSTTAVINRRPNTDVAANAPFFISVPPISICGGRLAD
jgi:hypothetical protein